MGDLLDGFMDELRRRQAGQPPRGPRSVGGDDDAPGSQDPDRPRPRRRGAPGGPNDGRFGGSGRGFRRWGIAWMAIVLVIVVLVFGRGLVDLATDVMWYRSVGYESVLWTRLGAQLALFLLGGAVALAALLGNLWLAGRLSGPPTEGSRGAMRDIFDRISDAARAAEEGSGSPWSAGRRSARPVGGAGIETELPDLVPIGRWLLIAFAILAVLGAAGALAGSWETILLWQNRVPFSATGASVTDPIFHRDISFFLFELPFLRLLQSFIVGILLTSLIVTVGRYLLTAVARGLAMTNAVRVHVAVLGALLLLAVALGYQLDKLELAYSGRGVGTGVGYTDANAQFGAYDILAIVAAIAAVVVVVTALTRRVVFLGVTVAVWLIASVVIGRIYPEAIQRLVVDPNEYAEEQPYIANNIAMTRLAF